MCASLFSKLLQSLLGGLDQSVEAGGIVDGHLAQHLAVQLDAGLLQAVHEGGVVHALGTNSVFDAGDPQVAELALLLLTTNESIVARLHHSLFGQTEMRALGAVVDLSQLQSFGATLMRHGCAFNTSHGNISFYTVTLSQVRK